MPTAPTPELNPFADSVVDTGRRLPFRTILEQYDWEKKTTPGVAQMTLGEYASMMNAKLGSNLFDAGINDSWIRRFSARLNQGLDNTGITDVSMRGFGEIGKLFGEEQIFRDVGRSFPRSVVDALPAIASIAAAPATGGTSLFGLAATGALTGSNVYEQTGSAGQALFAGGTSMLVPGVAGKAGQLGLRAAGASLVDDAGRLIADTARQKWLGYTAAQAGAFAFMEGSHQAQSLATKGELDLTKEHLIGSLVGQLPWLAIDAGTGVLKAPGPEVIAAAKAQRETRRWNEAITRIDELFAAQPAKADLGAIFGTKPSDMQAYFDQFKPAPATPKQDITVTAPTQPAVKPSEVLYNVESGTAYVKTNFRRTRTGLQYYLEQVDNPAAAGWFDAEQFSPMAPTAGKLVGKGELITPAKPVRKREVADEIVEDNSSPLVAAAFSEAATVPAPKTQLLLMDKVVEPSKVESSPVALPAATPTFEPAPAQQTKIEADVPTVIQPAVTQLRELSRTDSTAALKQVNRTYTEYTKLYGVVDTELANLNNEAVRATINTHLQAGLSLPDAIQATIDGYINSLEQAVQGRIDLDFAYRVRSDAEAQAKLQPYVEGLNTLEQTWQALPKETRKSIGRSPLEQLIQWREQLTGGGNYQKYSKYVEVDEQFFRAAGKMGWDQNGWFDPVKGTRYTEAQAKNYLRRAMHEFGYKHASRKEGGGEEATEYGVLPYNEAHETVTRLNAGLQDNPNAGGYYKVVKVGETGEQGEVKWVNRKAVSITTKEGEDVDIPLDSDTTGLRTDDGGYDEVVDLDTFDKQTGGVAHLKAEDAVAAATAESHLGRIFADLVQRLDINSVAMSGKRNAAAVTVQLRFMLAKLLDRSMDGKALTAQPDWTEFHAEYMSAISAKGLDPAVFGFETSREMQAWWNHPDHGGKVFLFGNSVSKGWFRQQPELLELFSGKTPAEVYEGMQQKIQKARHGSKQKSVDRKLTDPPLLEAVDGLGYGYMAAPSSNGRGVGNFVMTTVQFARNYFAKQGRNAESAQAHADATERLVRVAATFRAAKGAQVQEVNLPSTDMLGSTVQFMDPTWKAIVNMNTPALRSADKSGFLLHAVLGHEAWHVVEGAAKRNLLLPGEQAAFERMGELARTLSSDERLELMNLALDTLPQRARSEEFSQVLNYSKELPNEFVSTMAGIYSTAAALGNRQALRTHLTYGDGVVNGFMKVLFGTSKRLWGALKSLVGLDSTGIVQKRNLSPDLKEVMNEYGKLFDVLRSSEKDVQSAMRQLSELTAGLPENIVGAMENGALKSIRDLFTESKDSPWEVAYARLVPGEDKVGRIRGAVMDFMQMAEVHPTLKPYAVEGLAYQSLARRSAREMFLPLFERDSVTGRLISGEPLAATKALSKSSSMRAAFTELGLSERDLGRFANDTEFNALVTKHKLTPEQGNQLKEARHALANVMRNGASLITNSANQQVVHLMARIMGAGGEVPYKNLIQAAEQLYTVLRDPANAPLLPSVTTSLSTSLGIPMDKIAGAIKSGTELAPKVAALAKTLADQPFFLSEQRFKRYHATYLTKAGEKGRIDADTPAELDAKIARLTSTGANTFSRFDNSDKAVIGMSPTVATALHDMGKSAFETSVAALSPTEAAAARDAFQSYESTIERELAARGVGRWTQHHTAAPGREMLDLFENTIHYAQVLPVALSKVWLRDRASVVALDPSIQQNPTAASYGKQQIENILSPVAPWATKAKEWSFAYYLGGNLSSAVLEGFQPMLAVPAQLVKSGMSLTGAIGSLLKAYKTVGKAYATRTVDDAFIAKIFSKLETDGLLDTQTTGFFFENGDSVDLAFDKAIDDMTGFQRAKAAVAGLGNKAVQLSRNIYSRASGVSARVTAAAAAEFVKGEIAAGRMTEATGYDYVRNFMALTVPGVGGSASRPVGLYNGKWMDRSAAGVLASLQGYTISMTSMMWRLLRDSVRSKSFTSQDSKAFMAMFGSQLMLAGVLGLPGVGTAINLLNEWVPSWEVKKNLRQGMNDVFGSTGADIGLKGLPTVMSGVDFSARLGLANTLGVSTQDGFAAENLFGATGGIVRNVMRGAGQALEGEFGDAFTTIAPTAVKNITKLLSNGGQVYDGEGNLQLEPTGAEQFAMAVGFTPKRVADLREYNRLNAQADQVQRDELSKFYTLLAEKMNEGKLGEVRRALLDREKAHPGEFSAIDGLKLVTEKAVDRRLPEDPRRGGGSSRAADQSDLIQSYGMDYQAPSEVQRLQMAVAEQQRLGVPVQISPMALRRAQIIDQVMQQNPKMTRAQARREVDNMINRGRPKQQLPP